MMIKWRGEVRGGERLIFTLEICRLSFRLNAQVNLPAYLSNTTIRTGARMVCSDLIALRQAAKPTGMGERERERR
jgi:hypothetical protein